MKNIKLITLTFLIIGTFCNSQVDNPYSLFTGSWYHIETSNNQKFIVDFWVDGDELLGHYRLVQLDNNGIQINEIYNSDKEITTGYNWQYGLSAGHSDLIFIEKVDALGGTIADNTVIWGANNVIYAHFSMKIEQELSNIENCIDCTITAKFTTKKGQGLGIIGEPDLNVPRNIILTKE